MYFPSHNANLLHKDKEHLVLRDNFRVTKKFLTTEFDCTKNFKLHHENFVKMQCSKRN